MRESVFDELERAYKANRDRLFTFAKAFVKDAGLAEDVVHDVFATLAEDPRPFENSRNLASFLTVCARNQAISLLRKRKRREALRDVAAERPGASLDDPYRRASRDEENGTLLAAVEDLPDDLREVLALKVWGELTFDEIARAQSIAKSTAHARYAQALEKVRRRLARGTAQ